MRREFPQKQLDAVVEILDVLIAMAGLDKSESATETFSVILGVAAKKAGDDIRRSHQEGLCFDARWGIAETILGGGREWLRI
jgi:hypothetical protein